MPALNRAVLLAPLLAVLGAAPTTAAPVPEYDLKAAFVFRFTQFVEWPDSALSRTEGPFLIGVLGDDPFGQALDRMVAGESVSGRPVAIWRGHDLDEAARCRILFVGSPPREDLPAILQRLDGHAVLTVGEAEDFTACGGMIGFALRGNRVELSLNPRAAEASGLVISSKLLRLGRVQGEAP